MTTFEQLGDGWLLHRRQNTMVLINVRTIAYVRNFDPDHTLVYFAKVNDPLTLVTPVDVFLEALLRALDITKGGSHDSDA